MTELRDSWITADKESAQRGVERLKAKLAQIAQLCDFPTSDYDAAQQFFLIEEIARDTD